MKDYHDKEICDYMEYGWPIGFNCDTELSTQLKNHKGSLKCYWPLNNYSDLAHKTIHGY